MSVSICVNKSTAFESVTLAATNWFLISTSVEFSVVSSAINESSLSKTGCKSTGVGSGLSTIACNNTNDDAIPVLIAAVSDLIAVSVSPIDVSCAV